MTADSIIEVSGLTKRYPGRTAIDGLTFSVNRGEIVGFLGPNGAGKSTTMRILAGYLSATAGTARVAGYDVFTQSEEVRRRIGYMPENNPLYLEMRVREYLKFRARIKGLGRARSRRRVDAVIERCGLQDVAHRVIAHLSKGYCQRVGIADAIVHEPDLIILDEPTIGLDPHQVRAVRQLIKDLAGKHTVLISTHILPEVEMTCGRVIILHLGRILAADTTGDLHQRMSDGDRVVAEIAAPVEDLRACWEQMGEVDSFDIAPLDGEYSRCSLVPSAALDLRPLVFDKARERGWQLRELRRSRHSLEDIFVHMTRGNRDGEEGF